MTDQSEYCEKLMTFHHYFLCEKKGSKLFVVDVASAVAVAVVAVVVIDRCKQMLDLLKHQFVQ